MMKKTILLLSILSLLTAAGCSSAPADDTPTETVYTLIIEDLPDDSADLTDAAAEPADAAVSSGETGHTTETIADSTETASPQTESSALAETITIAESTAETIASAQNAADLLGTWEYVDGYRLRFMEENTAEMQLDYSSMMSFSEDKFYYDGVQYLPSAEEEMISVTLDDGTLLLCMTSIDRQDGFTYNGRYRLEDCQLYEQITEGVLSSEHPVYYIEVTEDAFRVIMQTEYHAASDGVLELIQNGSILRLYYDAGPDSLKITDETGAQDILTRVE